MFRNYLRGGFVVGAALALGACSWFGPKSLPPQSIEMSYAADNIAAATASAQQVCAVYKQTAILSGTQTTVDGGKTASFKCQ